MKADTIIAMLADPHIDPTAWVGEALVNWVKGNMKKCLKDPTAREYLLRGMESGDVLTITNGIKELYQETGDTSVLQSFVNQCNQLTGRIKQGDFNHGWNMSKVKDSLDKLASPTTVDDLVRLQIPEDSSHSPQLLKYMQEHHVEQLLLNRTLRWGRTGFTELMRMIPDEKLLRVFTEDLWDKHINYGRWSNWPMTAQQILHHVLARLPEKDGPAFFQWLKNVNARQCWLSASEFKSKKLSTYTIKIDEKICRCGMASASKPGAKLHRNRNKCEEGHKPTIYELAKVLAAQTTPLACRKCGQVCNSQPGHTLHSKKCNSELGNYLRKVRLNYAENGNDNVD